MMNIKTILTGAAISVLSFASYAQAKPFMLKGTLTGKTNSFVYLTYTDGDNKPVLDSASLSGGTFAFKGAINGVTEARIMAKKHAFMPADVLSVFLSPGTQTVTVYSGDFADGAFSGTAVADEMRKLKEAQGDTFKQVNALMNEYYGLEMQIAEARKKSDKAAEATLKETQNGMRSNMMPVYIKSQTIEKEFAAANPDGYIAARVIKGNLKSKDAAKRYEMLAPEVKSSSLGKSIKAELDLIAGSADGMVAANFRTKELRGEELSLSDFKGKYVLLDFWASWCVPCRAGHPHLLTLYNKYKDKGFEIIGISDDDSALPAWKKAIEDDKIGGWKHVLRGLKRDASGGFDKSNSITEKFSVSGYPTKILIDPNGVIVGRYGEGSLDKKLAEIFDAKTK